MNRQSEKSKPQKDSESSDPERARKTAPDTQAQSQKIKERPRAMQGKKANKPLHKDIVVESSESEISDRGKQKRKAKKEQGTQHLCYISVLLQFPQSEVRTPFPISRIKKAPAKAKGKNNGKQNSEDILYVVENIIGRRKIGHLEFEYLVKWQGYSTDSSTWEPFASLCRVHDMIERFENANCSNELNPLVNSEYEMNSGAPDPYAISYEMKNISEKNKQDNMVDFLLKRKPKQK